MPNKLDKLVRFALLAPFVAAMVIHGSTKPPPGPRTGRITFDTRYITDTGSYLTNDTVHIALAKTSAIIPDSTPVLVHAREVGSTNAEDWVELSPRLAIADFPHDYTLAGATNYDVDVMADYVPPAPVVTNDVLVVNALAAKDSTPPGPTLSAVLPRVVLVTPIEYLESTGTQYINTGIKPGKTTTVFCDFVVGFTDVRLFGARGNSMGDRQFECIPYDTSKYGLILRFGNSQNYIYRSSNYNQRFSLLIDSSGAVINGTTVPFAAESDFEAPCPMVLFAGDFNGTISSHAQAKVYAFTIWQNGVLILDLHPVRVGSTGAMLDLVSGRLFFNAGTGTFLLGPDL